MRLSPRFDRAISAIDAANSQDPRRVAVGDSERPTEVVYSERLTAWLLRLDERASESLRLAVRAQHLCRWTLPRDRYPEGRSGYKRWRSDAATVHAERAGEILKHVGYTDAEVARVADLIRKQRLKTDPEAQLLEDAACLVFLEHELDAFASKHEDDKLVTILRRTWSKMSLRAREHALQLPLSNRGRTLVERALASGD